VDVAVVDRARTATLVRAGAMGHASRVVEHFRRWGVLQARHREQLVTEARERKGLEQFIGGVVAELPRRGRFRTEYEYETFRENLGVA
jgi:hypothetical protein